MQYRCELSLRMDGNVDREIAEDDLFTDRAERPLVRQFDRAIGLLAGHVNAPRAHGRSRRTGREREQTADRKPDKNFSHKNGPAVMTASLRKVKEDWEVCPI
jgi:hypothetical protein